MTISTVNSASVSSASAYSGERVVHDGGHSAPAPAPVSIPSPSPAPAPVQHGGGGEQMSDAEFEKVMEEPIKQANKVLSGYDRQIEREVHEVTKTLMYRIKDTKTNEVIAEYPPKKIQDMIAKMWELAGLFIDQKA